MSKRKDVIRVGDRVKILKPEVVVRVGYPLTKVDMMKAQTPEQLKAIQDMFKAFGITLLPDMFTEYKNMARREDDRVYDRIRLQMAAIQLRQQGWGGKERRIHTHTLTQLEGKMATVDGKRVVKTGDYYPSWSSYDSWNGDYDYEPAGLSNENTHVLYKLYVDGFGGWWSTNSLDQVFITNLNGNDYRNVEIERCNLVKMTREEEQKEMDLNYAS